MDAGSQGTENHFFNMASTFATTYNKTATTRKQLMDSEYAAYSRTTNTYLMMKNVTAQLTTDEAQTVTNTTANPSTTAVTTVGKSQSTATTCGAMSVTTIPATTTATAGITITSISAKQPPPRPLPGLFQTLPWRQIPRPTSQ